MRKLVHVIFGVLKSGKKYDPNYKPAFAWQERYLQTNDFEKSWRCELQLKRCNTGITRQTQSEERAAGVVGKMYSLESEF